MDVRRAPWRGSRRALVSGAATALTARLVGVGATRADDPGADEEVVPLPADAVTATVSVPALNVRARPHAAAARLGTLPQGARLACLAAVADWFQVSVAHPSLRGYVYSPSVTLDAAHPARVIPRGLPTRPLVALTFDCGADRGYADRIVARLAAERIRASFGMTGDWADQNPDAVRRIVAAGHHLINHTRTHRSFTGASTGADPLSPAQRLAELEWTEAKLRQLVGRGAKPWFRTPYTDGDHDPGVLRDVAADGFPYDVAFTVDTLGWAGATADQIVARVAAHRGNGFIYLLHVGAQSQDALALAQVIAVLRGAGLGFAPVPEVLGLAPATAAP